MKREILCPACSRKLGRIDPSKMVSALDAAMAAREHIIKVHGKLRGSASCDFCNAQLERGTEAVCCTIVAMDQSYCPWEHEYLEQL